MEGRWGERERERNTNVREIHQLVFSFMYPYQGWELNLQPRYRP